MATSTKSTVSALWPKAIGSTILPEKTLSYRWIIHNAPVLLNGKDIDPNGFTSPTFEVVSPGTETVTKWQLVISGRDELSLQDHFGLSLFGQSSSTSPAYSLILQPSNETDTRAKVLISDCTFFILNSDTDHKVKYRATAATRKIQLGSNPVPILRSNIICNEKKRIGINRFIKQEDLTKYLDGHTLTLQVDAILFFLTDYSECVETCNDVLVPADSIREDLGRFHQGDQLFSDVTITCGGKKFRAHKVILASQSPVFKKMLEIDMRERSSGVIKVSDITPAVMSDLLAYIYTGTAPNVDTLARELLNVADKYELPRLLLICETTLVSKIAVRSVLEMLILAELHKSKILKKACLGFIKCNFAHISKLDNWTYMKASASHQNLVFEVLESSQQGYSTPCIYANTAKKYF